MALRVARAVALGVALLVAPVLAAPGAAAHGGAGALEVLDVTSPTPGTAVVRLLVTYENDGEPAEGAIVDAVATSPDGTAGAPVRLEGTEVDGVRTGSFAVTGTGPWTISVTSSFPPGSLDVLVEVAADGTATEAADPTPPDAVPEPTTASSDSSLLAASDEATEDDGDGLEPPEVGGAEGGSDTTNLVVAAVSGIVGGAGGLWVSRRRAARKRALDDA